WGRYALGRVGLVGSVGKLWLYLLDLPDLPDLLDLPALPDLPARLSRRGLFVDGLRRLWRARAIHRQADAAPERIDLALDLVAALHEVIEDRLVPLQPGVRDQLHPVAAGRLVRRLGAAVPNRDVGITRHEVLG